MKSQSEQSSKSLGPYFEHDFNLYENQTIIKAIKSKEPIVLK